MSRIALPGALAVLTVVSLVGIAGYNRSAERGATVTLTEREVWLPWAVSAADEDLDVKLTIQFQSRVEPLDARSWLTESKLRALGFPLSVPSGDPRAASTYDNLPPRLAWVAFEYDGPAWQEIDRRRTVQRQEDFGWPARLSRLVPVDADLDRDVLLGRYATNHLILRATVGLTYLGPSSGGPLIYGFVRQVVPSAIVVPRHLVSALRGLPPVAVPSAGAADSFQPRYAAEISVGRVGIPLLKGVRLLTP